MNRRFTLGQLFLTMTLTAVGVGGFVLLLRIKSWPEVMHEPMQQAAPLIYLGSAITIGIGCGVPFQQRTTGAVLAFILSIFALPVLVLCR